MKLDVIESLLTKYESSAVRIADERTQKVMFFNQLVKELCPEVEKDMNIDDFFGRILKKFDIETKNENTLLISDRTKMRSCCQYGAANLKSISSSALTKSVRDGSLALTMVFFMRSPLQHFRA